MGWLGNVGLFGVIYSGIRGGELFKVGWAKIFVDARGDVWCSA